MLKKSISIFMVITFLLVSLCGCNSNNTEPVKEPDTVTEENVVELVDQVNIATQAVGTSYYAMGTGIAKIISENTPIQATVLPYSGPDAWMQDLRDGIVTLGVIASMDLTWAHTGTVNYTEPTPEIRLLLNGNWVHHCTMTVLESSGIKSIPELKGKRVGYEYGGNKLTNLLIDAALASVDMTIDDCVKVPLADLVSAQRALQERRVDAIFTGSNTTPSSVQLDEAIGIRILPIGDLKPEDIENGVPPKIQAIMDEFVPGATVSVCSPTGTVKEDTVLITYPIQLAVSTRLSNDDVKAILEAIFENYEELANVHTWGTQWTPENYVIENFHVPYHEGAVEFYKEKGLWTDAADSMQKTLTQ